jgi:hypothetical protein
MLASNNAGNSPGCGERLRIEVSSERIIVESNMEEL